MTYDAASSTAVIGTGLIWDTVYERLQEHNVVVLGGRVSGVSGRCNHPLVGIFNDVTEQVGVGSWRFSGGLHTHGSPIGYSYKTNQHGLAIDTIVGCNLVLPNGTVTHVTESTHPDLFWGLKGGFNNFVSQFF